MDKPVVSFAALCLVGLGLWVGKDWYQATTPKAADPDPTPTLETIKAQARPFDLKYETVATLEAKKAITIRSHMDGKVVSRLARSGHFVTTGQGLLSILPGSSVNAPFDGYLTEWQVHAGENISKGQELVRLVNHEVLIASYSVPEHYFNTLSLHQTVEFRFRANPATVFQGRVVYVSPVIDPNNHTLRVRAELDNRNGQLRPGLFTRISQIIKHEPAATMIPESCLLQTIEGYQVYLVKQGVVVSQPVEIQGRTSGTVHIATGVLPQEEVVLTRRPGIQEGGKVKTQLWQGEW